LTQIQVTHKAGKLHLPNLLAPYSRMSFECPVGFPAFFPLQVLAVNVGKNNMEALTQTLGCVAFFILGGVLGYHVEIFKQRWLVGL
jgi:cytosine/uracil/thiamine/allantoin permease